MQTVNFQCGSCHNLMAVSSEFLGRQVRCPHCQQVVLAPVPTSPAPNQMTPGLPPLSESPFEIASGNSPANEHESIFGEVPSDDLFGGERAPVVEMPPEPPPPPPPAPPPTEVPPPTPPSDAPYELFNQSGEPTLPAASIGPSPFFQESPAAVPPADGAAAAPTEAAWTEAAAPEQGTDLATEALAPALPRSFVRQPTGLPLSLWLLIILIPYSILMTIIAVTLYLQKRPIPEHPLEYLPDIEGQNPGGKKVESYQRVAPEGKGSEVPPQLRLALGQSKRFGDLEVTPLNVELRTIQVLVGTFNPSEEVALVLRLHLKNISTDWAFYPTDPWFAHTWKANEPETYPLTKKPYTYLEMGSKRFYGGPIKWEDAMPRKGEPRQYIKEQNHDKELIPGQEMDTIVCTDPADGIERLLKSYKGPLLWRVQLRRGHEFYKGHEKSATCVVGVEFTDADIKWVVHP
jgi:hypothetical protein